MRYKKKISLCTKSLENSGITLTTQLKSGLNVEVEDTEIQRALLNLISNAQDAARDSVEKLVHIRVKDKKYRVEIEVANSGAPISHDHQFRIYEPFFTTKTSRSATEIGLSVAKGIIEAHNGSIQHLRENDLTKFVISLPYL